MSGDDDLDPSSLEFSGETYQVQVGSHLVFLQYVDGEFEGFCSCSESPLCVHIRAARDYIGREYPMHLCFERSFWRQLFWLFQKEGRPLDIQALTPRGKAWIDKWVEGRPDSPFEHSYWGDLAKYFFLAKGAELLPLGVDPLQGMCVQDQEILCRFLLGNEDWVRLIPYLGTVQSIYGVPKSGSEEIQSITFDPRSQSLRIHKDPLHKVPIGNGQVPGWIFVEGDGFYSTEVHPLASVESLERDELAHAMTQYTEIVAEKLTGCKIHTRLVVVLPYLEFDDADNLHIRAATEDGVFLDEGLNGDFGTWVYLYPGGFFPARRRAFLASSFVSKRDLSSFIVRHRFWFNMQEGFKTHLVPVEGAVEYEVDANGGLRFFSSLDMDPDERFRDFSLWVHVEGQGFFPKKKGLDLPLWLAGKTVLAKQVEEFIDRYEGDLQHVQGFFSEKIPQHSVSLDICWENGIVVRPQVRVKDKALPVMLFGSYCFLEGSGFFHLDIDLPSRYLQQERIREKDVSRFLQEDLPKLRSYVCSWDVRTKPVSAWTVVVEDAQFSEDDGRALFTLKICTHLGEVRLGELSGLSGHQFSPAGLLDLSTGDLEGLDASFVPPWALIRLQASCQVVDCSGEKRVKELLEGQLEHPKPLLRALKSELRSYQLVGVKWLVFLYTQHLSGLLCDDMGLGKTHQAMGLMAHIRAKRQGQARFLVVCPTSVIYPWQEKLSRFFPSLRVSTYHGSQRVWKTQGFDLLLTSYGIVRREEKKFGSENFDLAIFDEIQVAKNRKTRLHKSLRSIRAVMRLGLTGTPIENHLDDVFALFDVVLPGYLPDPSKLPSENKEEFLGRLIRPFVLRRRKEDVLLELPEKTEELVLCILLEEQKKLYNAQLAQDVPKLMEKLQGEGEKLPMMHIFSVLTRLKQIADHPALFLGDTENYSSYASGKWEVFVELLDEAMASSQKVVVFSQYLGMLDIMAHYFGQLGLGFACIQGGTRDRGVELRRFNEDPSCQVFLGSLHAVGLGVDLTAASVVIHYDRWWNAARENQATDRVHRMGQTRGVQVFKLVTKDTVEETIHRMIHEKGMLLEDVVGVDDQSVIKALDRDALANLFRICR